MSQINRWLREKEKPLLIGLCCLLMVAFVGGGSCLSGMARRVRPTGKIYGQSVSQKEVVGAARQILSAYQGQEVPNAILFARAWETLILNEEAKRYGIQASAADVLKRLEEQFAAKDGQGLDEGAYLAYLNRIQMPRSTYEKGLQRLLTAQMLQMTVVGGINMPKEEAWLWYSRENEKIQTRFIQIKAEAMAPFVKVDDEALKKFYDTYAETPRKRGPMGAGYEDPEKVQIEYVLAPFAKFAKEATVTEENIKAYYEKNKDSYLIPEKKDEKEDAKKDEAAKEEKPEPKYQPLEKVKAEIEKTLRNQAAQAKVDAVLKDVNNEIGKTFDTPFGSDEVRTADFKAIAGKFGIEYRRTGFFTADEVNAILPGAWQLSRKAFGMGTSAIGQPRPPLPCQDGKFIFQLVESKPPQPAPYDSVKEDVAKHYRLVEGMNLASRAAMTAAAATTLDEAAGLVEKEIEAIVKESGQTLEKDKGVKTLYTRGESKFFARTSEFQNPYTGQMMRYHSQTGFPGASDYAHTADIAFTLKPGQVGVSAEPQGAQAVFVLEKVASQAADRAEFDKEADKIADRMKMKKAEATLNAWLYDVLLRASPSEQVMKYLVNLPSWRQAAMQGQG